jgi:hypothetical protein
LEAENKKRDLRTGRNTMRTNNWLRNWVLKRIRYYESFLMKNPNSFLRNEIAETIKHLKDLV